MTGSSDVPEYPPISIICGPTASGKTACAVKLSQSYPVEIISADSRQVIRRLDIGTAKPSLEERKQVRFHLIDLIEPGERYTAFQYIEEAERAIQEVLARDKIPVVVGGTGLYLRALTEGVVETGRDDPALRRRLENQMAELGPKAMHQRLREIDPDEAAKVHPNNKVRVIRALEIYYQTGAPKTELARTGRYRRAPYEFEFFCIIPERRSLYERIGRRVEAMIAQGLVKEVERLVQQGLARQIRSANVIGYNEILDYLENRLTLDKAVSLIKQNSRRYAKRQTTWLKHQVEGRF
ncbi:MAG: tRNA (adenosine(37)-N6)-dimethylallyltransferase MiaA, partial [Candidatus Zixiibacteriota bacterium]